MIVIVDYGVGNLRSVQKALEHVGATAIVADDPRSLDRADGIVLPGVGAFGDGMHHLRARGWVQPLVERAQADVPLLGICLGMQLLFEESEEMGRHTGLGLLPGRVIRFAEGDLKVPHVGWNQLQVQKGSLLEGIPTGAYAYFVHSFYSLPSADDDVLATTEYGLEFASVVGRRFVFGAQFHPEKSQEVGLRLLGNFARLVGSGGGQ